MKRTAGLLTAALAAAVVAAPTSLASDCRSPDTRDAAQGRQPVPAPVTIQVEAGGFDWADAGIGAVGAFGLTLVVGGVALGRGSGVVRGARKPITVRRGEDHA